MSDIWTSNSRFVEEKSYAVVELVFCVYLLALSVVTWCGKIDHYVGGSNQRTVNESRNWDCIVQILVLLSLLWKARKLFMIMKKKITIETKTIVQWVSCLRMLHKKNFRASTYKVRFYNEFIRWRKQEKTKYVTGNVEHSLQRDEPTIQTECFR